VHWSPLYYQTPEPGAPVQASEPMNTAVRVDALVDAEDQVGPIGAGQIGESNLQRTLDFDSGPRVTAAPAPTNGIVIDGIQVNRNSAITLPDGRVASLDNNGNLIIGSKTWSSPGLFGQGQQANSRSNGPQGSLTTKGGSNDDNRAGGGTTSSTTGKGNGGRKKNEAVLIMEMWWMSLPIMLTIMIMML
jgi:hypothetical protein